MKKNDDSVKRKIKEVINIIAFFFVYGIGISSMFMAGKYYFIPEVSFFLMMSGAFIVYLITHVIQKEFNKK